MNIFSFLTVIVYRILTYLYECFQSGEQAELDMISPKALKINDGYWRNVFDSISDENYITGVRQITRLGCPSANISLSEIKIKEKGIEYLQENHMMKKAKEFLEIWEEAQREITDNTK